MKLKRTVLVLSALTTFAGFAAGCGPQETYCYDQHATCEQARRIRESEEMEKERIRRELEAGTDASDGGALVIDH
jgi:hypothetical protein